MPQTDNQSWELARRAAGKIEEKFLFHPLVSLIDVGTDPSPATAAHAGRPVVRVHLRKPVSRQIMNLPDDVDGIPVRIIIADYKLE